MVLDRHFPAGEVDESGSVGGVEIAQGCAAERAHGGNLAREWWGRQLHAWWGLVGTAPVCVRGERR